MDIEKITVNIHDKEYSFTVEIFHDEDQTIYRAVPDVTEGNRIEHFIHDWLDFDENGVLQFEDELHTSESQLIAACVWQAIHEQVITKTA